MIMIPAGEYTYISARLWLADSGLKLSLGNDKHWPTSRRYIASSFTVDVYSFSLI